MSGQKGSGYRLCAVPPFLSALSVAILITACGSTARRLDASSPGLLDLGDDAVTSPELDTIARDAGLGPSLDSNEDDVGAPGFDGQPYGVDATGGNHGCELQCGSASCCASLLVPGGTMTRTEDILDGGVAVEEAGAPVKNGSAITAGDVRLTFYGPEGLPERLEQEVAKHAH